MTADEFEIIIMRSEGDTIDFKREHYDLIGGTDESKAKFIKDIISFANTIRKESAFIIIGIEALETGKVFHGLNRNIDDAILQDQLKTRVYPIPHFSSRTVIYKGQEYGIIEIPLRRYTEPIAAVVKLKGLDPGRIYMRRGSSNSEAVGKEVILIDKWIKNVKLDDETKSEVSELLKEVNSGKNKMSYYISAAFKISNNLQDDDLIRFCKGELNGWYSDGIELNESNYPRHRKASLFASIYKIHNIATHGQHVTIRSELKDDDRFKEINFLFQEPITDIESVISRDKGSGGYITITRTMEQISSNAAGSKTPVYLYADIDDYKNVYDRVKTELIRLLIKINT
jgi:hypothetical protein